MISQNQRDFLINHIVDQWTEFIIRDYGLELPMALKMVYQSKVYRLLQDKEGDLYSQSPAYSYELLKLEIG